MDFVRRFGRAFTPYGVMSQGAMRLVAVSQIAILISLWVTSTSKLLPNPIEVASAFHKLWFQDGLAQELWTSFSLNLEALAWATGISLALAYLTVLPAFRPIVGLITKLRYMSMVGFSLVFLLMFGVGHALKVALLTFGMSVFLLTTLCDVVAGVKQEEIDHARTLRMKPWRVVFEIVVIGRLDASIEAMRQNAAIGWMMLTMVEVISRSEGGIGVLLYTQNKYLRLDAIFAIQLSILVLALLQDYFGGVMKRFICPHTALTQVRR